MSERMTEAELSTYEQYTSDICTALLLSISLRKCTKEIRAHWADLAGLAELRAQRDELLAALKDLFKLIDAGVLVRDISKDHETGFALHQLPLLLTLKSGQAAIARAEGASDAK